MGWQNNMQQKHIATKLLVWHMHVLYAWGLIVEVHFLKFLCKNAQVEFTLLQILVMYMIMPRQAFIAAWWLLSIFFDYVK